MLSIMKGSSAPCEQVQVGLAAGPMYAGHVGYAPFKSMVCRTGLYVKEKCEEPLLGWCCAFCWNLARAVCVAACPPCDHSVRFSHSWLGTTWAHNDFGMLEGLSELVPSNLPPFGSV